MKQLKATGNYQRQKAEVVKPQHEDLLWEKGLLGDHNPNVLLDTVVCYIGVYFAIRGVNIDICAISLTSFSFMSQ